METDLQVVFLFTVKQYGEVFCGLFLFFLSFESFAESGLERIM